MCVGGNAPSLKLDIMGAWIEAEWIPRYPDQALETIIISESCIHEDVLTRFDPAFALPEDFTFGGYERIECPAVVRLHNVTGMGELSDHSGAYIYRFPNANTAETIEVLVMSAYYHDGGYYIAAVACLPKSFLSVWTAFSNECDRLWRGMEPTDKVIIVGGRSASFVPTVDWVDIILPDDLKTDLMQDVESFFSKGIDIYRRLKLKPFRKLLLAGIPGTGKTMLCSALAKWALDQTYLVIYVSSADKEGAAFWKIEYALSVAAASDLPTLILLEELDAYLRDDDDKALVLNVLDGAESKENDQGTLLIATTNYPEAIDARILKRPGRLDRIFIIPEIRSREEAEKMLRHYLGDLWRDEHRSVAREMLGYPGAFVREVAIYAMTQMAFSGQEELSLALLEESFNSLLDQITAKDDFLTQQRGNGFGFAGAMG